MSYSVAKSKEEGFEQLRSLISKFENEKSTYTSSTYNETQNRNDFIDPLLMCFGWDVNNEQRKSHYFRDVIQEESIEVEDESFKKNPDYTLRVEGIRKLFVEAKKPSVIIQNNQAAAFQTRRYGWNANLGISILTNFNKLIIYDCRYKPKPDDDERISRAYIIDYNDLSDNFDELYELISYSAVSSGKLDEQYAIEEIEGQTFDEYFLEQIEGWREKLATSAVEKNEQLNNSNINFLIQRLLNRIIFLRICEDRTIERYETIYSISSYEELKNLFISADKKYNSDLFNFIEDTLSLEISINSEVLIGIFNELYYPQSPYDFSVIDSSILSQIYERFLGTQLKIELNRDLSVVELPEVAASNGVVPTPKLIVEQIVQGTLNSLLSEKSFEGIDNSKICDICCGSGSFLITAFEFIQKYLVENHSEELLAQSKAVRTSDSTVRLTLKAKKDILSQNIFGVDVNPYAVEVSKFSLLLKLLEDESSSSVEYYLQNYNEEILPNLSSNIKCGNSLVDNAYLEYDSDAIQDNDLLLKLNIFNWENEFPFLKETNGFDAIIGNPPYVRIQNLVQYIPEEVKFYQSKEYGYEVAKNQNIDKYYIFIQRAINLLNGQGYLGYIVPHKFFILKGGKALRKFITDNISVIKISHFGVFQVFPERSTYTAILICQKNSNEQIGFTKHNKITPELLSRSNEGVKYDQSYISKDPWIFLSEETKEIFNKIGENETEVLDEVADIAVGLQTSADHIYIFEPENETEDTFVFSKDGQSWEIEKSICRPFIRDLSFSLFETIEANAQIIFPYNISDGNAELLDEVTMSDESPLCWNYLQHHKESLEDRSLNGSDPKWYQFGRSQSLTRFHDTPKLIWHVLSKEPSYVLDNNDLQFTGGGNGPYYSLINQSKYSILYLMGILSHPLIEAMVKSRASEFRGSYYSHGKQFMKKIPIKVIDFDNTDETYIYANIISQVRELIETRNSIKNSYGQDKTILRRKYEVLNSRLIEDINRLYGITEEELNKVLQDEMLNNEILSEE